LDECYILHAHPVEILHWYIHDKVSTIRNEMNHLGLTSFEQIL